MTAATVLDVACSPLWIDPRQNPPLSPLRAAPYRTREATARHDAFTLLADIFRDGKGRTWAVGPPLPAAWRQPGMLRAWSAATGEPVVVKTLPDRHVMLPQHYRLARARSGGVLVAAGDQVEAVAVQPCLGAWFAGRRVLMAVSRDNRLAWVADWVRFHQVHHGVDAVLLFDNQSTAYASGDVARTVATVPEIAVVAVVPWAVGHGSSTGRLGWRRTDMNHGQAIAFALARRRFLAEAAWVLNVDIDELAVPLAGRTIGDVFAASGAAAISLPVQDLLGPAGAMPDPPRHRDVLLSTAPPHVDRPKWAVMPARCPKQSAWGIHVVDNAPTVAADPAELVVAHCRSLTTGWDSRDWRRAGLDRDAPGAREETALGAKMAEAFDGWEPPTEPWGTAATGLPTGAGRG